VTEAQRDALLIAGGFWLAALIIRGIGVRWLFPKSTETPAEGFRLATNALRGVISAGLFLAGVSYGLPAIEWLETHPRAQKIVSQAVVVAWILLVMLVAVRMIAAILQHQVQHTSSDANAQRDLNTRNSLIRKISTTIIVSLGVIYALRAIGADVTPLLAGGTVGGIILGLALQDSLSHFFAGILLNMDRPARIGDLVRLEDGKEGFLEEIGWRYTKIRLWSDALLVIPNNKFAQAAITNLHRPIPELVVPIDFTVGYDNDLDQIEEISVRVAKKRSDEIVGAHDFVPYVRFKTMNELGIGVRLFVRSGEPEIQYRLTSEILRDIQREFRQGGIEPATRIGPLRP
jgi:small-conductance mechanosensitive channel